jgi:hypothetical protein
MLKMMQLMKSSHYVRFAYTDLGHINGHWGIVKEFDVSTQMWNIALFASDEESGLNVVQVASGKLLAYFEKDKELTNLVSLSEAKRFNLGLISCSICKELIVFNCKKVIDRPKKKRKDFSFQGTMELNYLRFNDCGHEIHSSCVSIFSKCPICVECEF